MQLRSRSKKVLPPRIPVSDNASDQLSCDLRKCREELLFPHEGATASTDDQFFTGVSTALMEELGEKYHTSKATRGRCKCSSFFKILWICLMLLLAFGLIAAGFKPVAFLVHKVK